MREKVQKMKKILSLILAMAMFFTMAISVMAVDVATDAAEVTIEPLGWGQTVDLPLNTGSLYFSDGFSSTRRTLRITIPANTIVDLELETHTLNGGQGMWMNVSWWDTNWDWHQFDRWGGWIMENITLTNNDPWERTLYIDVWIENWQSPGDVAFFWARATTQSSGSGIVDLPLNGWSQFFSDNGHVVNRTLRVTVPANTVVNLELETENATSHPWMQVSWNGGFINNWSNFWIIENITLNGGAWGQVFYINVMVDVWNPPAFFWARATII